MSTTLISSASDEWIVLGKIKTGSARFGSQKVDSN